jgi:hypothetical protein
MAHGGQTNAAVEWSLLEQQRTLLNFGPDDAPNQVQIDILGIARQC